MVMDATTMAERELSAFFNAVTEHMGQNRQRHRRNTGCVSCWQARVFPSVHRAMQRNA